MFLDWDLVRDHHDEEKRKDRKSRYSMGYEVGNSGFVGVVSCDGFLEAVL